MEADVSRVGEVVGDEVAGVDGNTMTGGSEVGPRGEVGAKDVESVTDVGTEGRFVGSPAGEVSYVKVPAWMYDTVSMGRYILLWCAAIAALL